ncbi:hypothetical protein [Paenibacillus sp. FSL R7-0331]|uniref:hypothetical protein n=1 Tax=Paenibacillus sp. FSL R7-0331 TaxID=1536773 RepID=UPI000A75948E|nr:hypothetical protein [Paenibacillus sp. FSL R7-0331]
MVKQTKATPVTKDKPGKKDSDVLRVGKREPEFAEELTSSDIESAFKNPVTGEERMY